jgi:hypothetical protein
MVLRSSSEGGAEIPITNGTKAKQRKTRRAFIPPQPTVRFQNNVNNGIRQDQGTSEGGNEERRPHDETNVLHSHHDHVWREEFSLGVPNDLKKICFCHVPFREVYGEIFKIYEKFREIEADKDKRRRYDRRASAKAKQRSTKAM